ncbi:NAD-dependent epimerase/dehydratase family protein [Vagococcus intermedius]|uniref:NAD-dependent epimerase/dehydratase family protein n=1 Tax=Vagococcus intermedius TaxID=2991418 RepID=A0AAF0CUH7_9ENTE|nr:NAD-dependent epimerase/dehydratase family protein [Vagococcus intermedius]WEG73148.1 NAD-dependent epimerase/dehydratase family protein [Vagococcus intermedius]WEG75232.1 NAD-dependent epimerase/dehydratase family protein [Vagococcus intermedius]
MKKIFILGGTGFLGYYTLQECLATGYSVKTMALPPMPKDDLLPDEVECTLGNFFELSDSDIIDHLSDCYGVIYAAGADERTIPQKPAFKFFYEANVLPTQRLARLAKQAGVEKFIIFGSYFAEFAERLPDYHLEQQAYPGTRLLQEQVAFCEGEGSMAVMSLRLPYIFGTMPGRTPLWKMFTDQIKDQPVFPALKGGTAMVTAHQVAQAAVGALEKGSHRETYAICGHNMSYKEFYEMMVDALGQTDYTTIPVVAYESMVDTYRAIDEEAEKNNLEHGIKIEVSTKLQTENLYLDPDDTMTLLGYQKEDLITSIKETLTACL